MDRVCEDQLRVWYTHIVKLIRHHAETHVLFYPLTVVFWIIGFVTIIVPSLNTSIWSRTYALVRKLQSISILIKSFEKRNGFIIAESYFNHSSRLKAINEVIFFKIFYTWSNKNVHGYHKMIIMYDINMARFPYWMKSTEW